FKINWNSFYVFLITGIMVFFASSSYAQKSFNEADTFPLPPASSKMMFYLQRTPNLNTVIYELRYNSNGQINADDPIHVYWIRYTEPGNPKKDLNYIQRKFAYGVKTKLIKPGEWEIRLVSYDKIKLILKKGIDGKYHVFINIHNQEVVFEKSYIKIDGGTFWSPNVIYIELFGRDPFNNKSVSMKVYPK
ncbi:MAG: DUF4833 domain-containing protein, partial [Xanthomarina sp.]